MQLPTRLGEYSLVERLARGESTDVYLARWDGPPTDGPVRFAVKVTHDDATENTRRLLLQEATLARRLVHPHIARTIALGEEDERAFQVMELCDGPSLSALLADGMSLGRTPTPVQALELSVQVLEALRYAHELEDLVLHLRVNPRNILVTPDHRALLADFAVPRTGDATLPGKALGSAEDVGYLAPEQIVGMPVDQRADQFAVAAVLWELLCGRTLFKNERDAERAGALQPSRVKRGVPPLLDDVVLRALERDPNLRFETIAGFSAALVEVLDVLDPEKQERKLSAWFAPILAGDGQESTAAEILEPQTVEVAPDAIAVEPSGELDVTQRNVVVEDSAIDGAEQTVPIPTDLLAAAVRPAPAAARELEDEEFGETARAVPAARTHTSEDDFSDRLDRTMPAGLVEKTLRHTVTAAHGAFEDEDEDEDGDKDEDRDEDEDETEYEPATLQVTLAAPGGPPISAPKPASVVTAPPAAAARAATRAGARAAPTVGMVGGGALALGLLIGGLVVWMVREEPEELIWDAKPAEIAGQANSDPSTAPPTPSGVPPSASAETPSGRCGKAPVGDGYERARAVVADARDSLVQRDFMEATRLLNASLGIAATSAAHYELGRLSLQSGDVEAARRALGCALVLAPASDDAQRAAVELARLGGDTAGKAGRLATDGQRARPRRATSGLRRDVVLDRLGKCDSPCARLLVDAVGRRTGKTLDGNLVFAVEECLDQCKVLAGRRVGQELARTATRAALRGDFATATKTAQRGLALSPDDASLHRLLGTIYKKKRRKALAHKHFSRYLQLQPDATDASKIRSYVKELR